MIQHSQKFVSLDIIFSWLNYVSLSYDINKSHLGRRICILCLRYTPNLSNLCHNWSKVDTWNFLKCPVQIMSSILTMTFEICSRNFLLFLGKFQVQIQTITQTLRVFCKCWPSWIPCPIVRLDSLIDMSNWYKILLMLHSLG